MGKAGPLDLTGASAPNLLLVWILLVAFRRRINCLANRHGLVLALAAGLSSCDIPRTLDIRLAGIGRRALGIRAAAWRNIGLAITIHIAGRDSLGLAGRHSRGR